MKAKTEIYELTPTNGRKSFCGKAKVIFADNRRYLFSYNTIMGCIDENGKPHRYSDYHSNTTRCHVKAFFGDSLKFWELPLEKTPTLRITI